MKPAVFADRDGTLCVDKDYLSDPDELELIPGAVEGARLLRQAGFAVVVVSNQSGVARGMFGEERVQAVNARFLEMFAREGVRLDGMYYCPHHPTKGEPPYRQACGCRKPAPGMVRRAAAELGLDVTSSYTVGDKPCDVQLAYRAGCIGGLLVKTGLPLKPEDAPSDDAEKPIHVAADFLEAARWIANHIRK